MIRATVVIRSTSTIESSVPERVGHLGSDRREDEEERRGGKREAGRERAQRDRDEERHRDDEYDDGEVEGLGHVPNPTNPGGRQSGAALTVSLRATHYRLIADPDT